MTRDDLIAKCNYHLGAANGAHKLNKHEHYAEHMNALLDLLLKELYYSPPGRPVAEPTKWNPEMVLNDIATAIKHRTISTTMRWNIVYYYKRITCVPTYVTVPPEIILHEFTGKMVHDGFTPIYWNQLKQNLIAFYKELHE